MLIGTLPDHEIAILAESGMINPFVQVKTNCNGVSYGLGSCSYDVRVGDEWLDYNEQDSCSIVDVTNRELFEIVLRRMRTKRYVLGPGKFVLATTMEAFRLPDDIMAVVKDKSTWARLGLAVQNTLIDPGFCGQVTLELTNHGPLPLLIRSGSGIAQMVFTRLAGRCRKPYGGRYQGQIGVTAPIAAPADENIIE